MGKEKRGRGGMSEGGRERGGPEMSTPEDDLHDVGTEQLPPLSRLPLMLLVPGLQCGSRYSLIGGQI